MIKIEIRKNDGTDLIQNLKEKAKRGFQKTKKWASENKGPLMVLGPIVISSVFGVAKGAIRGRNLKKEEYLKKNYCYDASLGHYWKLKRPLTNREWVQIDARKQSGERLSEILSSMRVLK